MPTILFASPIFGPVVSRRLGISLGVNLLPADGKLCNFDCIYCECGFNSDHRPKKPLPTREEVRAALEARLQDMQKKLEIRNQWAWKSLLKDAGKVTEEEAEEFLLGLFNYQMALRRGENDILKDLLLRFCLRK